MRAAIREILAGLRTLPWWFWLVWMAFLGMAIWWEVAQWQECRAMGLSRVYCWKHIA